jgi:hypothetical protein
LQDKGSGRGNINGKGTIIVVIMLVRAVVIRATLKQSKGNNYG